MATVSLPRLFVTVLIALLLLHPGFASVPGVDAADGVPRIMAIGDSITEAQGGHASYRHWLYKRLLAGGYATDFVGGMYGVYNGTPLYPDFDQNHEGHWGWRADQVLASIEGWSRDAKPNVVLIHLGTNDIFQKQTPSSTIAELGQIIDKIRINNPSVAVLLAQVIPSTSSSGAKIPELNALVPGLAASKHTTESPVVVVDQWTGYTAATDNYDGTHPNELGEQKLANKWYEAMLPFLPPPGDSPFVDGQAPTIALTNPAGDTIVARRTALTLAASASDNVGVDRVQFFANGALLCTDTIAPFTCNWQSPQKNGTTTILTARAWDATGRVGEATGVKVTTR
jgi:lysophospholipase L1-like esterase